MRKLRLKHDPNDGIDRIVFPFGSATISIEGDLVRHFLADIDIEYFKLVSQEYPSHLWFDSLDYMTQYAFYKAIQAKILEDRVKHLEERFQSLTLELLKHHLPKDTISAKHAT